MIKTFNADSRLNLESEEGYVQDKVSIEENSGSEENFESLARYFLQKAILTRMNLKVVRKVIICLLLDFAKGWNDSPILCNLLWVSMRIFTASENLLKRHED